MRRAQRAAAPLLLLLLLAVGALGSPPPGSASDVEFSPIWDLIGPFSVGPRERGADPLERFGGLRAVYEAGAGASIESDLVDGGTVRGWRNATAGEDGSVRVQWGGVRWDGLQSVFGEAALLFQGHAVGRLRLRAAAGAGAGGARPAPAPYLLRCSGAPSFRIDFGESLPGDLYGDGTVAARADLTGEHTIAVPLGGFAEQTFRCSCLGPVAGPLTVLGDILVPSFAAGEPQGSLGSLLVANTAEPGQWLRDVTLETAASGSKPGAGAASAPPASLAPGQIAYLPFPVPPGARGALNITISGTVGGTGERFAAKASAVLDEPPEGAPIVFTFQDADGSVQAAAARSPTEPCGEGGCAVLLTTHGAGVDALRQAECYRARAGAWLLAPTNRARYGYDWEGPGMQDALRALAALAGRAPGAPRGRAAEFRPDPSRVLFAGHSMGGHGCWELATHYPDLALGAAPAAAWIKMSNYIPPVLRAGDAYVDPQLRSLLDAAAADYDVDLLAPHLAGMPIFARAGGDDDNVHPWHLRRMTRMAREAGADVRYHEIPGKGHWFDGVLDDDEIGAFFDSLLAPPARPPPLPPSFRVLTLNPSTSGGRGGLRILQLIVPARLASVDVTRDGPRWSLATRNARRLRIAPRTPQEAPASISLDGGPPIPVPPGATLELVRDGKGGNWRVEGQPGRWPADERSPETSGPLRQVLEGPALLVAGAGAPAALPLAAALASRAAAAGRAALPVLLPAPLLPTPPRPGEGGAGAGLVLLGGPNENAWTARLMAEWRVPVSFRKGGGEGGARDAICVEAECFSEPGTGIAFLAPWRPPGAPGPPRLAAVLAGTDAAGLRKAAGLLPISSGERVPDFMVVGPRYGWAGSGGVLAAGYWGWDWGLSPESSFARPGPGGPGRGRPRPRAWAGRWLALAGSCALGAALAVVVPRAAAWARRRREGAGPRGRASYAYEPIAGSPRFEPA
eukprot:tig00000204_g17702.t1